MKIIYAAFFFIFITAAAALPFYGNNINKEYMQDEIKAAAKKAVPSPVYGEIKTGTKLYISPDAKSDFKEALNKKRVLVLKDFSLKWYYIETEGKKAWVKGEDINIPSDPLTADDCMTDREIECYINTENFKSKTDKFIWVDIHRQRIYILKKTAGSFRLEKRLVCGTGKNCSPTTRGLFEISDRGEWFYSLRLKSGAKYWVRFNGNYLIHSIAMDKEGNITDPTLGKRCSSGCVRVSVKDAEYIYKTVPKGTAVWVN